MQIGDMYLRKCEQDTMFEDKNSTNHKIYSTLTILNG